MQSPIDGKVLLCMIMVDEASRMIVPHFLFEHEITDSRNRTGLEAVQGIQGTWVSHYGITMACLLLPVLMQKAHSGQVNCNSGWNNVELKYYHVLQRPMDKLE